MGLSVGVAAALLLFMAVRYEFSFDSFHPNGDRIYRVVRMSWTLKREPVKSRVKNLIFTSNRKGKWKQHDLLNRRL